MADRDQEALYARLYRSIYRVRLVEEEIARIYPSDKIKSPVHLSIGQEAVSVGVCDPLRANDVVFGSYRGHAMYLAKGGNLKRMIAELYGKETGCTRGKGGSMHLIDVGAGIMGTSAIVATPIPQAMGYAYALKCRGEKRAVVCFFGEAATEEGAFHESMNFAVLKQLPVLFVCENNFFSIQSPVADRQGGRDIRQWVEGYGLPAVCVEGNDILEIRRYADGALAAIRKAGGPAFLECKTYRWRGHVGPEEDWHLGYRTLEEAKYWIDNDQLKRLAGRIDREVRESLEKAVTDEVAEAFEFAEDSAFPADGELWEHVFHGQ